MKSVAIVILNWNGKRYLEQFFPSVIEHSVLTTHRVEVIVADNGSTDDSVKWLQDNYPEIRIIVFDKNYGFTAGYNLALQQVTADYYLLLNSDIKVERNWLSPLLQHLDSNPMAAGCMPKLLDYNQTNNFEYAGASGGFLDILGYPFCRGRVLNVIEEDEGQYDQTLEIFWATGACMLIKANCYWEAGGLDNDFFAHMEEIDLCWRLKRQGYSIWCVPKSKVYHVGGGTLAANNPRKAYYNHRNNLVMLAKNLSRRSLLSVLITRLLLDIASATVYAITGKPSFAWSVFKAHCYFFGNIVSTIKKRRAFKFPKISLYPNSIVHQFFIKKRRYYSKLPNVT